MNHRACLTALATACATALSAALSAGQTSGPPAPAPPFAEQSGRVAPVFRTAVDLVALTVTVTDAKQRYVDGLRADDFLVFEDGVRQPLTFFSATPVPLDVAVLIDASASMRDQMALTQEAALGLVRTLRPGDRAGVVQFRDRVELSQPLTANLAEVERAIGEIRPAGGTALHNALYIALKEFGKLGDRDPHARRQAIVVLSDGDDTASLIGMQEVLDLARRGGVTIYAISLRSRQHLLRDRTLVGNHRQVSDADYSMRVLARETGGQAFFPAELRELGGIYHSIATELASQYALGYSSLNPRRDGAWRRVTVQLHARPDARPRTRAGYFAGDVHRRSAASNQE